MGSNKNDTKELIDTDTHTHTHTHTNLIDFEIKLLVTKAGTLGGGINWEVGLTYIHY